MRSSSGFSGVRVAQSLFFPGSVLQIIVCPFSFGHCGVCPFSFGHCVVCPFSFGKQINVMEALRIFDFLQIKL
jgi:hypothetical protein